MTSSERLARIQSMSAGELWEATDFEAAPDGVGGHHYRLRGAVGNRGRHQAAYQRMAELTLGRRLPDGTTFWCWDETPWCINVDHAVPVGSLPQAAKAELEEVDEDGTFVDGFQVQRPQANHLGNLRPEPGDADADRWMRENGYAW